ncbi:MAG: guanylate kinase [Clostridia bacterium]|nr:guanylate kinase [Clostridia bacterium]
MKKEVVNLASEDKGLLVVLSAPAGCGKDTVLAEVKKSDENVKQSISMTTRFPREGEKDGVDYYFTSKEDFENKIKENGFLEYVKYGVNYYGTPKKAIEEMVDSGKTVILKIEVEGAGNVRKIYPDAVSIFIMPPSLTELSRRLKNRGTETEEDICRRLKIAEDEMQRAKEYNYIVINDDLSVCVNDVLSIIKAERLKYSNMQEKVEEIINN